MYRQKKLLTKNHPVLYFSLFKRGYDQMAILKLDLNSPKTQAFLLQQPLNDIKNYDKFICHLIFFEDVPKPGYWEFCKYDEIIF